MDGTARLMVLPLLAHARLDDCLRSFLLGPVVRQAPFIGVVLVLLLLLARAQPSTVCAASS